MEDKLFNASMEFYRACDTRLEQKEKEGWEGWDNKKKKSYFEGRIRHDAFMELNQKRLVHIANFCDFLWNLIGDKREVNNVHRK